MARTNPFTVTVYDKNLAWQQRLGSALSYSFTPRTGLGTGELITRVDDPVNALLGTPGARVVVQYRGEVAMSGFVQLVTGSVLAGGQVTWTIWDDAWLLSFVRAWIRPGQNLTPSSLADLAQQVPYGTHVNGHADGLGYYAFPSPPVVYAAESAIKQVISENLARFPASVAQGRIVVQPDQARGGDARAAGMLPQLRFEALTDGLADLLDWSKLLLRVWQEPNDLGAAGSLKLDVFSPKTWAQTLSPTSATIADGTYQQAIPTLTRPVLGGPGDDAARLFYGGPTATSLEALYGFAIEGFIDATGSTLKWPDGLEDAAQVAAYFLQRTDVAAADQAALVSYLQQAASTALADGQPTNGLSIDLSESPGFHYGGSDGYHVGDIVTVQAAGGPTISERITEVELRYDSHGFTVSPQLGDITDDATKAVAQAVGSIAKAINRLRSRK